VLCQARAMDDFYGELGHDYEWLFPDETVGRLGKFGATSPGSQALLEAAVKTLGPGAPVLDCACGIGADAMALARKGLLVTATDGSHAMVAEARRRSAEYGMAMTVTWSQWQDLPNRVPGPFELVLCLGNSLVHTETRTNRVAALEGMRKVLSPGGTLIVDSRNWELMYSSRPGRWLSDEECAATPFTSGRFPMISRRLAPRRSCSSSKTLTAGLVIAGTSSTSFLSITTS
jgi:SAM-dependent methyltransferase